MNWQPKPLYGIVYGTFVLFVFLLSSYLTPGVQLLLLCSATMAPVLLNRFSFSHPLNCCLPFGMLYALSFPTARWIEGTFGPATAITLRVHCAFLVGVAMVFLSVKPAIKPSLSIATDLSALTVVRRMYYLVLLLGFIGLIAALRGGYSSKRELLDSQEGLSALLFINAFAAIPLLLLFLEVLNRARGERSMWRWIDPAVGSISLLLAFAISGERDFVFRGGVFASLFIFEFVLGYRSWMALVAMAFLSFVAPLTSNFKASLIGYLNGQSVDATKGYAAWEEILSQEFSAAGRNTHLLISHDATNFGVSLYKQDVFRAMHVPGYESSAHWFHHEFRDSIDMAGSSGWGFTLAGEAYVSFGIIFVLCFAVVYGFGLLLLYNLRKKNEFFYGWYCFAVFGFIYTQRGDFANLLAFMVKTPVFQLAAIFIVLVASGVAVRFKSKVQLPPNRIGAFSWYWKRKQPIAVRRLKCRAPVAAIHVDEVPS